MSRYPKYRYSFLERWTYRFADIGMFMLSLLGVLFFGALLVGIVIILPLVAFGVIG